MALVCLFLIPISAGEPATCECKMNEVCVENRGIPKCRCRQGFQHKSASAGCTDINECAGDPPPCHPNKMYCINTIGSYTCQCIQGLTWVDEECSYVTENGKKPFWSSVAFVLPLIAVTIMLVIVWKSASKEEENEVTKFKKESSIRKRMYSHSVMKDFEKGYLQVRELQKVPKAHSSLSVDEGPADEEGKNESTYNDFERAQKIIADALNLRPDLKKQKEEKNNLEK